MVIPQYLGASSLLITSTSIFNDLFTILKLVTGGVISSLRISLCLNPAFKSLATPKWLMASALFGVNPISKTSSTSTSKTSEQGVPTFKLSGSTIIPSWLSPNPSSSSAQIMPWLSSPRIFPFFMTQASPSAVYRVVPMVATGTFCPASTLGAPQTICKGASRPIFTVVNFNLSALGCFTQVKTSPTTIPLNPPLTDSKGEIPSTSRPKSVNNSAVLLESQSIFKNCFNQL